MKKIDLQRVQALQSEALKEIDRICSKYGIKYFMITGTLIGAVRHKGFIPWDDDIDIAMMRSDYDKFLRCCPGELNKKYFLQNYHTDVDFYPPITRICIFGTYINEYYSNHLKFHKGLYLDIHPIDNVPDSINLQKNHEKRLRVIDTLIFYKLFIVYRRGPLYIKLIGKKFLQLLLLPIKFTFLQRLREKTMKKYAGQKTLNVSITSSKYGYFKTLFPREVFGEPVLMEFEASKFYAPQNWHYLLQKIYGNYMDMPPDQERKPLHKVYEIE